MMEDEVFWRMSRMTHLAMLAWLFFLWTCMAMASASAWLMEPFLFIASARTTASCQVFCQLRKRRKLLLGNLISYLL